MYIVIHKTVPATFRLDSFQNQECSKSRDSRHKTSYPTDLFPNRATEPKCKFMLAMSPESAHK